MEWTKHMNPEAIGPFDLQPGDRVRIHLAYVKGWIEGDVETTGNGGVTLKTSRFDDPTIFISIVFISKMRRAPR